MRKIAKADEKERRKMGSRLTEQKLDAEVNKI